MLKGSKKAIRIYSPAKYPIAKPPKFVPTHLEFTTNEINFNYNLQNVPFDSMEGKKYSDKLQFFHLKRSRSQATNKPSLVFTTKSVNSLITFVNNENIILNEPALKFRAADPALENKTENDDTTDFSRFSSLMKSKHDADSFHYFPNMNQAPDIELPMDLPDLPGIADDISFTISDQELIAPSLGKMNILNDLPNVAELIEAETSKKLEETAKLNAKNTEIKVTVNVPPAPPIPVNIPSPPPVPKSFVPMPPPPPMLNAPSKSVPTSNASTGEARSSLLQAIRNAGGKAKLRSVPAADEQEPQTAKKKPQAAPAGDLMSDLHAKLAMRRRGIAGSKEARKEKASIMEKVSSLIPPPAKRDSTDDSGSSDSDWN